MTGSYFVDYLQASADTYSFLSRMVFRELNEQAIQELAQEAWPADTGNEHLDMGYRYLRRYFHFSGADRQTQLAIEYARIFLAAGVYSKEKNTAVPYESVFTSEEHEMMGPTRLDVVRRFAEDGFQVNPNLHEPEDHLSFELEYMSTMSARAIALCKAQDAKALHANIARQLEFLEQHLLNWTPQLLEAAQRYAKTAFYLGMLNVMIGTFEQSQAILTDVREHGLSDDEDQAQVQAEAPGALGPQDACTQARDAAEDGQTHE